MYVASVLTVVGIVWFIRSQRRGRPAEELLARRPDSTGGESADASGDETDATPGDGTAATSGDAAEPSDSTSTSSESAR
jgi:hypothetical protein